MIAWLLRAWRFVAGLPSWVGTVVAVVAAGLAYALRPRKAPGGRSLDREQEDRAVLWAFCTKSWRNPGVEVS